MKVTIVGTHGTGKSTLAYQFTGYLKSKGYNATLIEECASQSPLGINEAGTLESQMWIAHKQMIEELEKGAKYDIIVCDRSLIDGYVYTLDLCTRQNRKVPKWYSMMFNEHIKTYDLVFKTQIVDEYLVKDGVRSVDGGWQQVIEDLFVEVLKKKKINHIDLPKNNQLEFIIEEFEEHEESKSKDKTSGKRITIAKICN